MKKVAAIHDISCFGRCSLTVALPILSAAGINCAVIPTAVLSTHTGDIDGFTYRNLTDEILPIANHWRSLGLSFEAIYSGFLGSFDQIDVLKRLFKMFHTPDCLVLVDPVMGDEGQLYKTFSPQFPKKMLELVLEADLITPNVTEAALLTNEEYRKGPHSDTYIVNLMKRLVEEVGKDKRIVITGVSFNDDEVGAAVYEGAEITYVFGRGYPGQYPGTGDVYSSVLLAKYLNGFTLTKSAKAAADFVSEGIKRTIEAGDDPRFGIQFEALLKEGFTRPT